jgi:hypothetical protein
MFRLEPGLRAGILAAALWLASGACFAVVVWFGLYRGDVIRLILVETVPVEIWQRAQPWPVVIALASSLAFGASSSWAIGRLHAAAPDSPRSTLLLGSWLLVVLAGAAVGLAAGVGSLVGSGVPRLAFLAQGVPDAAVLGVAAGLLYGWMPAWLSLPRRRPAEPTLRRASIRRTRRGARPRSCCSRRAAPMGRRDTARRRSPPPTSARTDASCRATRTSRSPTSTVSPSRRSSGTAAAS